MKKNTFNLITLILMIFILAGILVACDILELDNKENTNSVTNVHHIDSVVEYVKGLSNKYTYEDVSSEMKVLGISREEFEDIGLIKDSSAYLKNEIFVLNTDSVESYDGTVGLADRHIIETRNEQNLVKVRITTSVSDGNLVEINGCLRNSIHVTTAISVLNPLLNRKNIDIIEIKGDEDLVGLSDNSYDGLLVESGKYIMPEISSEDGILEDSASTVYKWDNSVEESDEYMLEKLYVLKDDYTDFNSISKYYTVQVSFLYSMQRFEPESITIGASGVYADFDYKNYYSIFSSVTGFWIVDNEAEPTETSLYLIGNNHKWETSTSKLRSYYLFTSVDINEEVLTSILGLSNVYLQKTYINNKTYWTINPNNRMGFRLAFIGGILKYVAKNDDDITQIFKFVFERNYVYIVPYSEYNSDGTFTKCLGFNNEIHVELQEYTGSDRQQWFFTSYTLDPMVPFENTRYNVKNLNSSNYMDVSGAGTTNGTNLIQYQFNGAFNQQFKLVYVGDGDYKIVPCHAQNMAISIENSSNTDGANVVISEYNGSINQKFRIERVIITKSEYKILSKVSNYTKCLSVANVSTDIGANIHQWTFESTTNELNRNNNIWQFI